MSKVILKFLYLPMAILGCTAAGSIFTELNNIILFQTKYSLSASTVNWFSFAIYASVLFGIIPSMLYRQYGTKKTLVIGGGLLSIAHVAAALMLRSAKTEKFSTFLLFLIGIIGGQGACIVFITLLCYMLQYHSIVCCHLLNALLFTYFLGSDTFHEALKYGVFTDVSLETFLFILAIGGMAVYVGGAFLFKTMKKEKSMFSSGLAKGLLLKKNVEMYIVLLAVFLTVTFLFAITFQQYSFWGSRVLCLVLLLNLLIPVIAISLLNSEAMKKQLGKPSDIDEFMVKKGGSADLAEAQSKNEFWLILFSFAITIGVGRMMDENCTIMAEWNSSTAASYKTAFQMFESIGCFVTGIFLALFRIYFSPYVLWALFMLILVVSQVLMFFISVSSQAMYVAMILVGFVSGGCFCLIGVISQEDYGTKHMSKILGYLMTGAAVGILLYEIVVFDILYDLYLYSTYDNYSDRSESMKSVGQWNFFIFLISLISSVMALIMGFGSYLMTRKSDGGLDKAADFVNL